MRRSLFLAATAALALGTAFAGPVAAQSTPDAVYAAALADPVRTDADRARDAARHTARNPGLCPGRARASRSAT